MGHGRMHPQHIRARAHPERLKVQRPPCVGFLLGCGHGVSSCRDSRRLARSAAAARCFNDSGESRVLPHRGAGVATEIEYDARGNAVYNRRQRRLELNGGLCKRCGLAVCVVTPTSRVATAKSQRVGRTRCKVAQHSLSDIRDVYRGPGTLCLLLTLRCNWVGQLDDSLRCNNRRTGGGEPERYRGTEPIAQLVSIEVGSADAPIHTQRGGGDFRHAAENRRRGSAHSSVCTDGESSLCDCVGRECGGEGCVGGRVDIVWKRGET
mmetsp:Transcript_53534/g.125890  ORF Transcript_53534/g.125890 Transcript_53534/m.125890 type:complete len:265 (-) Transcript_53534:595-1389(-)